MKVGDVLVDRRVYIFLVSLLLLVNVLVFVYYLKHRTVEVQQPLVYTGQVQVGPPYNFTLEQCYDLYWDWVKRMECFRYYGLKPVEDCERARTRIERVVCYAKVVKKVDNISSCQLLSPKERYQCYHTGAHDMLDPDICEKIVESEHRRYFCYGAVAGDSNDTSICDRIPASDAPVGDNSLLSKRLMREMCYASVAVTSNESRACNIISDQDLKVYCRALATNNSALCDTLSDEFHKSRCLHDNPWVQRLRVTPHPDVPGRAFDPFTPIYAPVVYNNTIARYW